jgi:hypothetical protein
MAPDNRAERFRKLYGKLLRLYPKRHREQFGESMRQTFNDLCKEREEGTGITLRFLLWIFFETSAEIVREKLAYSNMKTIYPNPNSAALTGFLFILPFAVLNVIVAKRVEPFFSMIRPGLHTSPFEYVLLAIVLLLIPIGAFSALRPSLRKAADGRRRFYLVNGATAALLLTAFAVLSIALGSDIYNCDILGIPNCD